MNFLGLNSPAIFVISVIVLIILGPKRVEKGWLLFQRLLKFLLSNEEDVSKDKLNLESQLDLQPEFKEIKEEAEEVKPEAAEIKEVKVELEELKPEAAEIKEVKVELEEKSEVVEIKEVEEEVVEARSKRKKSKPSKISKEK